MYLIRLVSIEQVNLIYNKQYNSKAEKLMLQPARQERLVPVGLH